MNIGCSVDDKGVNAEFVLFVLHENRDCYLP